MAPRPRNLPVRLVPTSLPGSLAVSFGQLPQALQSIDRWGDWPRVTASERPLAPEGYNGREFCLEVTALANHGAPSLRFEVETKDDTTLVKCYGRVLHDTAGQLKGIIQPMIPLCPRIVVDCSQISFLDSAGLGMLVALKSAAGSSGKCRLEFVNFPPLLKELLSTTMLGPFLGAK